LDFDAVKDAIAPNKKKLSLKIKRPVPKPSIAGNWKESDTISMFGQHAFFLLNLPETGADMWLARHRQQSSCS
jgi:hypothetical protein